MSIEAKFSDYFFRQGGKPQVFQTGDGLWHIVHHYMPGKPEVVTHISPEERGRVVYDDGKTYKTAYLWEFEGKPCETQSIKNGGDPYKRRS